MASTHSSIFNKYHLFYTSKATYETRDRMPHLDKHGSGSGYVAAASLDQLSEAKRYDYVKKDKKHLNLLEAVYPHPTRKNYWESRNRFMFAMVADKLEGPWERVELEHNEFMGDPAYLFNPDGSKAIYDQVSHLELIRSGYDQRLEIEDYQLQLLFQAFDADTIGSDYDYNYLPWKLMLMKNFNSQNKTTNRTLSASAPYRETMFTAHRELVNG